MDFRFISILDRIEDRETVENIQELAREFVSKIAPLKIVLFGSFAKGSYTEDSDYDFYLVVDDDRNIAEVTREAYKASLYLKKRPVDIVVGSNSRFERKRRADYSQMVEREVEQYGILLYEQDKVHI